MKEQRIKLGVNIDHVATLRQARKDIDRSEERRVGKEC